MHQNTKKANWRIYLVPYGRVNHKIFMVPMEYLITKHLEINKKKGMNSDTKLNITLHKKECKWPVNCRNVFNLLLSKVKVACF